MDEKMQAYLLEQIDERAGDLYDALKTAERRILDAKRKMARGQGTVGGFVSILSSSPSDIDLASGALRSVMAAANAAGCTAEQIADAYTRVVGD